MTAYSDREVALLGEHLKDLGDVHMDDDLPVLVLRDPSAEAARAKAWGSNGSPGRDGLPDNYDLLAADYEERLPEGWGVNWIDPASLLVGRMTDLDPTGGYEDFPCEDLSTP